MVCILCLKKCIKLRNIKLFSTKGEKLNILHVMKEHMWLTSDDKVSNESEICNSCWNCLYTYHQFYLRIKKKKLGKLTPPCDIETVNVQSSSLLNNLINEPDSITNLDNPIKTVIDSKKLDSLCWDLNGETLFEPNLNSIETTEVEFSEAILPENVEINEIKNINIITNCEEKNSENEVQKEKKSRRIKSHKGKMTQQFDDFISKNFKLTCCLCDCSLLNFFDLETHFRLEHKVRGYVLCCGKKFLRRGVLVDHINIHLDPNYFKCHKCDKVMADRRCLEVHMKVHEGAREKKFQCDVCLKRFHLQIVFMRHMQLHVPEDQKIPCPQCKKSFANEYVMTQHLKTVHLNMWTSICDVCGKSVRGREALQRHQQEHAGVQRNFLKCEICSLKLATKYALARHIKMRHTEENLQPINCPVCAKVSPNLQSHQRHFKYVHRMQRKHVCPMCEKAFKRTKELKEHMTTHTGEVLYECPHCTKTFNSNANMHAHRKKMHREEWEEQRLERLKKIYG